MKPPAFWGQQAKGGLLSTVLLPFAGFYVAAGYLRRKISTSFDVGIPVICIGNINVGGTGKTPVALSLGAYLKSQGKNIHYLSRGYGGRQLGPLKVDINKHSASDVGDEPLLLAQIAPTWVAKDRVVGAKAAVAAGADIIIMDDGFQNPHLLKTLSFIVVDAAVGFGNGAVIPAGPLRETITAGLARADAVILLGQGDIPAKLKAVPVYRASLKACAAKSFKKRQYIAFAGIGRPDKFFDTIRASKLDIKATYAFSDHHPYCDNDILKLKKAATSLNAQLITTEKDFARLSPEMRKDIVAFPVLLYWDENISLDRLLKKVLTDG